MVWVRLVVFLLKLLTFLGILVATGVLTYLQIEDTPPGWLTNDWLVVSAILVVGLVAASGPFKSVLRQWSGDFSATQTVEFFQVCDVLRYRVARLAGIPSQALGSKVFLKTVRSGLRKAAGLAFENCPASTGVHWTTGKGVIGKTLTSAGRITGADISRIVNSANGNLTEQWWATLSEEDKLGLTLSEFERASSYACVLAVPVLDQRGRYLGCVTLESGTQGVFNDLWANSLVEAELNLAAAAVRAGLLQ